MVVVGVAGTSAEESAVKCTVPESEGAHTGVTMYISQKRVLVVPLTTGAPSGTCLSVAVTDALRRRVLLDGLSAELLCMAAGALGMRSNFGVVRSAGAEAVDILDDMVSDLRLMAVMMVMMLSIMAPPLSDRHLPLGRRWLGRSPVKSLAYALEQRGLKHAFHGKIPHVCTYAPVLVP